MYISYIICMIYYIHIIYFIIHKIKYFVLLTIEILVFLQTTSVNSPHAH